ncbi:DUF4148 domain-containing protein [Hydrogenophaga sp.]|uniref:DUF4148 domain-containing protein n=1 Tax=Hydrogenophaga sp. TaxID=1904254 RepID=UPI0025BC0A93|nr:DUF4148 domain-containing protein [Hydrogenophaga sp.]MBT9463632.1 DUF4148 domain-containing protein [Hydrogenophaga sp.]
MKNVRTSIIALALTALSAGSVFAADMTPKTREQVRAELMQAQRDGTLIADGQTGATFRQVFPGSYMQPAAAGTTSRDQIRAELMEAKRNGTLVADGQTGATFRDLSPQRYPTNTMQAMGASSGTTVGMGQSTSTMKSN